MTKPASNKKIAGIIKLQVMSGAALPAPPVGPALGKRGLNIGDFCKQFNALTSGKYPGARLPVIITAYADRTFTFQVKKPTVSYYLFQAAGIKKGSSAVGKGAHVGKVTKEHIRQIATEKMCDMNAFDIEHAMSMIAGSAQSVGIEVVD